MKIPLTPSAETRASVRPNLLLRLAPFLLLFLMMFALSGCLLPPQVVIEAQEATATALAATPTAPIIAMAPTTGAPGTLISVSGAGWQPGDAIYLKLESIDRQPAIEGTYAVEVVSENGTFATSFPFPLEVQWQDENAVLVVALSTGTGQRVTAPFQVVTGAATATATALAATAIPATVTTAPTATPTSTAASAATPTRTATSASANQGNRVTVLSPGLNVRSGPSAGYASIAVVTQGDVLTVIGQSSDGSWILVRLPNGVEGWVASAYTTYGYTGPVVTPQPRPSPTVTPYLSPTPTSTSVTSITEWRGDYFPNRDLAGAPVLTRNDSNIDFNWGSGSPASNIGSDNFSVRWTRTLYFDGGAYRFHAVVDDGIRLWVDNNLVIDQWWDNSEREVTGDISLGSGNHDVRVEYYEHTGNARIVVWWERIDTGSGSYPDWKGEYWTNRHLDDNPRIVRNDRDIDFNWGNGSPDGAIPSNNFSVRWTRRVRFADGLYRFYVRADDGVRVWVDGERIIDEWHDNLADETYTADRVLDGREDVRVEYYEREGGALIDFWWERIHPTATPSATPVAPTDTPTPTPTGTTAVGPTNTPAAPTPTPTFVPPTPTYTPAPSANVQPGSATVGTMITVSGGGYPASATVNVHLGALLGVSAAAADLPVYASTQTDGNGNYSVTFAMPATWKDGRTIGDGQLLILVATADLSQQSTAVLSFAAVATATPLPTDIPLPPTDTPVPPPTDTPAPLPTDTPGPTATPAPPTNTPLPATDTPVPPPTDTPLPAPTDTPVPQPFAAIAPAAGGPGTQISVSGGGFPANVPVAAYLGAFTGNIDPAQFPSGYTSTVTDGDGNYAMSFAIPATWPDGTPLETGKMVVLVATGDFGLRASALFDYIAPTPVP